MVLSTGHRDHLLSKTKISLTSAFIEHLQISSLQEKNSFLSFCNTYSSFIFPLVILILDDDDTNNKIRHLLSTGNFKSRHSFSFTIWVNFLFISFSVIILKLLNNCYIILYSFLMCLFFIEMTLVLCVCGHTLKDDFLNSCDDTGSTLRPIPLLSSVTRDLIFTNCLSVSSERWHSNGLPDGRTFEDVGRSQNIFSLLTCLWSINCDCGFCLLVNIQKCSNRPSVVSFYIFWLIMKLNLFYFLKKYCH